MYKNKNPKDGFGDQVLLVGVKIKNLIKDILEKKYKIIKRIRTQKKPRRLLVGIVYEKIWEN